MTLTITKKDVPLEVHLQREEARLNFNTALLGISFTIFTLIATINPKLFQGDWFLTIQLVLTIPLFVASIFARSRALATPGKDAWDKLSFLNFVFAYSFLINSIGIILSILISPIVVFIFFGVNVLCSIMYSVVQVKHDKIPLKQVVIKDLTFIILIVLLGLIPALRVN